MCTIDFCECVATFQAFNEDQTTGVHDDQTSRDDDQASFGRSIFNRTDVT